MVGGLDNSTGIQGKDNSNVPNLSGDAWRKPQPTVEQDATIGAPPTGSGGNTTWRAGYNQVAPIFPTGDQSQQPQQQPQQQTQWRPGYNGVAPIFNGNQQQQQAPVYNGGGNTEVYNPNANGNQNNGPVWHAPTNTPGWNAPGPAQNPAAKPGDASTGGQPTTARTAANNANNLYDPHRADIDPFLNHPIGFGGDLVIGGVAGVAFGGPIPYMLSHTAESIVNSAAKASGPEAAAASPLISESGLIGKIIPGDWRAGVNSVGAKLDQATAKLATSNEGDLAVSSAKWYQNHFDPRYFTNSGLETQLNNFKGLNNQVTSIIDSDAKELAALQAAPDLSALSQADRLRLEVLSDRQDWLNTDAWKTVSGGASQLEKLKALQLDAATSPKVQGPLFDPGEMKLLQDRQEARASYNEMYNKKADGAGFWGDSPGLNFIKGAGFVGVTMLADNYLDRLFAGKDHKQGLNDSNMFTGMPLIGSMSSSWHTNALLLPMAFASGSFTSPRGLITKAAWTAGALVGGHVLDAVLPASANKEVSSILSPNGVDAVLMAGSWLMPAANLKQRLLMIGGAWAVGRVVNLFRGPSNEDVKDDGYADMQKDTKQRTLGSMEDSINYFKEG
jgi:hypothetical protein